MIDCEYVGLRVFVCVCVSLRMNECVLWVFEYVCVCVCAYMCECVRVLVCVNVCVYVCECVCGWV